MNLGCGVLGERRQDDLQSTDFLSLGFMISPPAPGSAAVGHSYESTAELRGSRASRKEDSSVAQSWC